MCGNVYQWSVDGHAPPPPSVRFTLCGILAEAVVLANFLNGHLSVNLVSFSHLSSCLSSLMCKLSFKLSEMETEAFERFEEHFCSYSWVSFLAHPLVS